MQEIYKIIDEKGGLSFKSKAQILRQIGELFDEKLQVKSKFEQNVDILNEINCLKIHSNLDFDVAHIDVSQGHILIFIGEPQDEERNVNFFVLNQLKPYTLSEEVLEGTWAATYPRAKSILVIHPTGMKLVKNKRFKVQYKTYSQVYDTGVKWLGVNPDSKMFKPTSNASWNYNQSVKLFADNISTLKKACKYY